MFNINERIIELRTQRNWSEYHLAEKSGIVQSTISSWSRTNAMPTIQNLEKICNAFGITLSQFFSEKKICRSLLHRSRWKCFAVLTALRQSSKQT